MDLFVWFKARRVLICFALLLIAHPVLAQEAPTPSPRASTPVHNRDDQSESTRPAQATARPEAPAARPVEYVEEKGFKGKVFEVKYREPSSILNAVSQLGSGFKGARMSHNDEFKTITVRDFPENLASIEEAIKRLDTPQPSRPDIQFNVHVLIASDSASGSDEVPAELSDVVKQLKATLRYKSYSLMTSSIQRTKEGFVPVNNEGIAESKLFSVERPLANPIFYHYTLTQVSLEASSGGAPTVQMREFSFGMRIPLAVSATNVQYQNVGFRAPVSIRDGERVVVGTTTMGDKGLVVVISARVTK
jgi:hypothetical protein